MIMNKIFKIDAVFVGPQKTATTWLYEVLKDNPSVSLPKGVKETFYWERRHKTKDIEWYASHFSGNSLKTEIGPGCFHDKSALEAIAANNKDCKIVVTLRDPSERAFSHYLHHVRAARVSGDFRESAEAIPEITEGSRYKKYLPLWIDLFGSSNVLILFQEDIKNCPDKVLKKVCDFLNIDNIYNKDALTAKVYEASSPRSKLLIKTARTVAELMKQYRLYSIVSFFKSAGLKKLMYSSSQETGKLPDELRQELVSYFMEDILYIEKITGRDLSGWKH